MLHCSQLCFTISQLVFLRHFCSCWLPNDTVIQLLSGCLVLTFVQHFDEKHRNSSERTTCIVAGSLQAELHQLSGHNIALAAENMQMKHEMEQTVSLQKELALSKQVWLSLQL